MTDIYPVVRRAVGEPEPERHAKHVLYWSQRRRDDYDTASTAVTRVTASQVL